MATRRLAQPRALPSILACVAKTPRQYIAKTTQHHDNTAQSSRGSGRREANGACHCCKQAMPNNLAHPAQSPHAHAPRAQLLSRQKSCQTAPHALACCAVPVGPWRRAGACVHPSKGSQQGSGLLASGAVWRSTVQSFHFNLPVTPLEVARALDPRVLACPQGRRRAAGQGFHFDAHPMAAQPGAWPDVRLKSVCGKPGARFALSLLDQAAELKATEHKALPNPASPLAP